MFLPMPYKSKSALPFLSWMLIVQVIAGLLLLMCILGCDEETQASSSNEKTQVGGIVKNITPAGESNGRVMMLIEFENGVVANVNYRFTNKVFTIQKGKYNLITFDRDCDVTEVQQIDAEVTFP